MFEKCSGQQFSAVNYIPVECSKLVKNLSPGVKIYKEQLVWCQLSKIFFFYSEITHMLLRPNNVRFIVDLFVVDS